VCVPANVHNNDLEIREMLLGSIPYNKLAQAWMQPPLSPYAQKSKLHEMLLGSVPSTCFCYCNMQPPLCTVIQTPWDAFGVRTLYRLAHAWMQPPLCTELHAYLDQVWHSLQLLAHNGRAGGYFIGIKWKSWRLMHRHTTGELEVIHLHTVKGLRDKLKGCMHQAIRRTHT